MRYWLVMPAAGRGHRFGDALPKQYAAVHGRTVLEWALSPFLDDARCRGAVVAVAPDDPHWERVAARLAGVLRVTGGAERSESVRNALRALQGRADDDDWIVVHDAARPCLDRRDLDLLLERLADHPVGGLLAAPVADTLKRAAEDAAVERTVDRAALWRALTPQVFRYAALCEALDRARAAGRSPTDESQALEWAGARPLLVPGAPTNIKITSAPDLAIAAAVLADRLAERADTEGRPS